MIWIGLPLLLAFLAVLRGFARLHRRLAGRVLGTVVLDPYAARTPAVACSPGSGSGSATAATWRDLAWLLEVQTIGFALQLAALIAFPFLPLGWWGSPLLLRTDAATTRLLIGPQDDAAAAADRRAGVLPGGHRRPLRGRAAPDRAGPARRRPGPAGRAGHEPRPGRGAGRPATRRRRRELIAEARRVVDAPRWPNCGRWSAASIRRCWPTAAWPARSQALALAHPLPVEVDIRAATADRRRRSSPRPTSRSPRRSTNAAKHAAAQHDLGLDRGTTAGTLTVMVGDDGVGGAELTAEGGLRGIERRLAAFDGTLTVASPLGGPTIVTMEVPCALQGRHGRMRDSGSGSMRVVLAEDLALLRDGLIRLLTAHDFEVVEAVDNGPSLLRGADRAPAGRRRRRRPAAADVHRRGPAGRARGPRRGARPAGAGALSQYVEQLYARELLAQRHRRGRLPAQGPGLGRRAVRRRRSAGSPAAAPRWTRR